MDGNRKIWYTLWGIAALCLPAISNAKWYGGSECKGNPSGKYSLKTDCSSYINCFSNNSYALAFCPTGKKFDAFVGACKPEKMVDCSEHHYAYGAYQRELRYTLEERSLLAKGFSRHRREVEIISRTRPFGEFQNGEYIPYLVLKGSKHPNCTEIPGKVQGRGMNVLNGPQHLGAPPPLKKDQSDETIPIPVMPAIKRSRTKFIFRSDDIGGGAAQEIVIGHKVHKNRHQAWTQKPNHAFTVEHHDEIETHTEA